MKSIKLLRKFFYVEMGIAFLVLIYWGYTAAQESIQKAIGVLPFFLLLVFMLVFSIADKDLSDHN
ncbi:MAG: hypothetical protein IKN15_04770 [Bacteroidaceae bacterium]|nr:hypothetical protein [Bacteroidaceae bacterium]